MNLVVCKWKNQNKVENRAYRSTQCTLHIARIKKNHTCNFKLNFLYVCSLSTENCCGSLHNSSPTVPFLRIRNQRRRVHFVRLSDCKTKLRQILIDCAIFVQLAREEQHMVFIFKCRRKWCRFGKAWYCYDSA